ncbi:PTS sugar transporter subunit IIA [Marinilactibacillus psychrotolerans]|uniref:PTS sugar transporter subunit IIA n=1 Tax=Marinilactibacillus psychrotolerans TaxID=191770 RepID=UPI0039B01720
MKHYIIATHGNFAKGIYESIKIVVGEQENVHIVNAFVETNDIEPIIKELIESIPEEEELIICTDIFGGSVNNEFMKYIDRDNYFLITGTNLPLLMQLFLSKDEDTEQTIRSITDSKDTAPIFCNDLFNNTESEEDF